MWWKNIPPLFKGRMVHILGGGPSLKNVDIERLRGEAIIAVNDAFLLANFISVMYFHDGKWFYMRKNKKAPRNCDLLAKWHGIKVTTAQDLKNVSWLKFLEHGHIREIDDRKGYLTRRSNGGFASMMLAEKLGGAGVYLHGFDMRVVDGRHNYHDNHARGVPESIYESMFIPVFKSTAPLLAERGFKVINATPNSGLGDIFPNITPEESYPARG